MALPRVSISFSNGNLPQPQPNTENKVGLVVHATPGGWTLGSNQLITSVKNIPAALDTNVADIIKNFYQEAGEGTELWVRTVLNTVLYEDMPAEAEALANATGYSIRTVLILTIPDAAYSPTITDGMDEQVYNAAAAAQALGEDLAQTKYAPLTTLLHAYAFTGDATQLVNFGNATTIFNRVGIIVADQLQFAACVLARVATTPVQRNLGRVASDPIALGDVEIDGTPVEDYTGLETLHDKRYIVPRRHPQKAGIYITDDPLCANDDYRSIASRRTIDKAYGIAYLNMVGRLLEDVPINSNGTIQASLVKAWQQSVVNDIVAQMQGEISGAPDVPGDLGVSFFIDATQNVQTTSQLNCVMRIRPVIHARYIDVDMGFALNLTQIP
jgi:Protein of unknown function (DUF2586)